VIYLDTSVALAHLLAEDKHPPEALWKQPLVSSRLLEYELWTRLNARGLAGSHGEPARRLLQRLAFLELLPNVLSRALQPFRVPVRTVDAVHLASMDFLRTVDPHLQLASYDDHLVACARALGVGIARM